MQDKLKLGEKNVTGNLADNPKEVTTRDGKQLTTLRVLENQRMFDRQQQQWINGETVGYDVAIGNDRLGARALAGLSKGDRVTVRGDYQVSPFLNPNTGEPGMNHRIAARDVAVSMFDDRFEPGAGAEVEADPPYRALHEEASVEQGLGERSPLSGPGTPPPPGVPQQTSSVDFGPPTTEQRREVAERQQRAAESWSVAHQQQQMSQQGLNSPSM